MAFFLQDPGDLGTTYLLEVLIEQCRSATSGGASFAWASERGVNLLLENDDFSRFLKNNTFDLVVGVDAVTDEKALQALSRVAAEFNGLVVSVFLNTYSGSIFHPKVCWFRQANHGHLITGSGNLTEAGLSSNWEAFTVTKLSNNGLSEVQARWSKWKMNYAGDLYPPTEDAVLERARKNTRQTTIATSGKKLTKKKLPANKKVGQVGPKIALPKQEDVLVAEIPKGSNRWNQANFDLDNYEHFFGAKVGTQRHMFFRHIQDDGSVAETETRPSVAVKSSNWRFELAAASGLKYPKAGRPIAVFVRHAARNFLYRLVMPGRPGHEELDHYLKTQWKGPATRIRRVRTTTNELKAAWKNSPLWEAETMEVPEL